MPQKIQPRSLYVLSIDFILKFFDDIASIRQKICKYHDDSGICEVCFKAVSENQPLDLPRVVCEDVLSRTQLDVFKMYLFLHKDIRKIYWNRLNLHKRFFNIIEVRKCANIESFGFKPFISSKEVEIKVSLRSFITRLSPTLVDITLEFGNSEMLEFLSRSTPNLKRLTISVLEYYANHGLAFLSGSKSTSGCMNLEYLCIADSGFRMQEVVDPSLLFLPKLNSLIIPNMPLSCVTQSLTDQDNTDFRVSQIESLGIDKFFSVKNTAKLFPKLKILAAGSFDHFDAIEMENFQNLSQLHVVNYARSNYISRGLGGFNDLLVFGKQLTSLYLRFPRSLDLSRLLVCCPNLVELEILDNACSDAIIWETVPEHKTKLKKLTLSLPKVPDIVFQVEKLVINSPCIVHLTLHITNNSLPLKDILFPAMTAHKFKFLETLIVWEPNWLHPDTILILLSSDNPLEYLALHGYKKFHPKESVEKIKDVINSQNLDVKYVIG